MGVQGFPTLKIVKPGKEVGRPNVEDYQGSRDAKGIVNAVIDKIPNHVKWIGDKGLDEWLKKDNDTAKAILFSNKGTTSALIKSLAVDFLGGISFAQIRDKEQAAVKLFGIDDFPSLVLLPGGTDSIPYDGEMKKEAMSAFLSQVTPPNPDPAPPKAKSAKADKKADKKKEQEKSSKAKSAYDKASAKHASSEATEAAAGATSVVLEEDSNPTESPDPMVKGSDAPKPVPVHKKPPPIPKTSAEELERNCLGPKSKTCILVLLPSSEENKEANTEVAATALESLALISDKYAQRQAALVPFYIAPPVGATALRQDLGIKGDGLELVAINVKRGWWKRFVAEAYGVEDIENWIDAIRLGDGKREVVPKAVVKEPKEGKKEAPEAEKEAEKEEKPSHEEL